MWAKVAGTRAPGIRQARDVGYEEEADTVAGSGQSDGAGEEGEEHDERHRHEDLVEDADGFGAVDHTEADYGQHHEIGQRLGGGRGVVADSAAGYGSVQS